MYNVIRIPIKDKIITEKLIKELTNIILSLKDNTEKADLDEHINIKIEYVNGIEVSSSDNDIFDDIKFKEIEINKICMNYSNFLKRNYVYVNINNGDNYYGSEIRIESKSEDFLGNINYKVNSWIEMLPNQNKFFTYLKKHSIIEYLMALFLAIASIICLNDMIRNFNFEISNEIFMMEIFFSILGYLKIIEYIHSLYPSIEIKICDNEKRDKIKKRIGWVVVVVVIPIFVNLLNDIIKILILRVE